MQVYEMFRSLVINVINGYGLLIVFLFSFTVNLQGQIIVPASGCSPVELFDQSNPWTFGGANSSWLWDNPNKLQVIDDITGGGKALILGGNTTGSTYNQSENSWAESPEYDLSAADNPYLEFFFYWSNEGSTNYDEIWMEYSLDNGGTWSDLATPVGTGSCYDQNWYNYPDNWGGNIGGCFPGLGGPNGWVEVRKCINDLANEPSVKFRFRLSTGTTCQNYGATVDNFAVCDAAMDANASYECTPQPLEISFTDLSQDCPTDWLWDFGDNSSSSVQNPIHTYAQAGVYTVSLIATASQAVTSGCGGPFTDTFTFQVELIEPVIDSLSQVSCFGFNDGYVQVGLIGAVNPVTYTWQPNPNAGQSTNTISNLSPGSYDLTVTAANTTCLSNLTVQVTEPSQIQVQTNATDATCPGNCDGALNATISGGMGGYSATWMPGNINGLTPTGICPDSYDLMVTDVNGCQFNALNVETVGAGVAPAVDPIPDYDFCIDETVNFPGFNLNAASQGVNWQVVNGVDIGFGLNGQGDIGTFNAIGQVNVQTLTEIVVHPVANNNCVGITDTFLITVHPLPLLDFEVDVMEGCEPLTVNFTNLSQPVGTNYTWYFGDGDYSLATSAVQHEYENGTFSVTLAQTNVQNCSNTIEKLDLITVNKTPKANFIFSPEVISDHNLEVHFTNLSTNATSYTWDFGDFTGVSNVVEPDYLFEKPVTDFYRVTLVAENGNNCIDEISKPLYFREDVIFYIPNAFTPDGNVLNQTFKPIITSGVDIYNYEFKVYNRWGEVIFISNDPQVGWNGCYGDNCDLTTGSFVWQLNYGELATDKKQELTGVVTLIK